MKNTKSSGTLTLNIALELESSELNKLFIAICSGYGCSFCPLRDFLAGSQIATQCLVKNKTDSKWCCCAKPHLIKPRLNYSFNSPRNGKLNWSVRNRLVSTRSNLPDNSLPCPIYHLAITNLPFFFFYDFLVSTSFCLKKSFILYSS